jgi:hypothetical protein
MLTLGVEGYDMAIRVLQYLVQRRRRRLATTKERSHVLQLGAVANIRLQETSAGEDNQVTETIPSKP